MLLRPRKPTYSMYRYQIIRCPPALSWHSYHLFSEVHYHAQSTPNPLQLTCTLHGISTLPTTKPANTSTHQPSTHYFTFSPHFFTCSLFVTRFGLHFALDICYFFCLVDAVIITVLNFADLEEGGGPGWASRLPSDKP